MILFIELIFIFERHMAYSLILFNEALHFLLDIVTSLFSYSLEFRDDIALLLKVAMLFAALTCTSSILRL